MADDVSDTPDAEQMVREITSAHAATWQPHGAGFVPDGTSLATPEGGQPSTDDELLARAEFYLDGGLDDPEVIIIDLASALRRQRDEIALLRERIVTVDIDGRTIRYDKLAECEAALASVEAQRAGLERELAEARSHGEVLCRKATSKHFLNDGASWLSCWVPDTKPGAEVLVVRADQEKTDGE